MEENAGVDDFIYSDKDGVIPFNKDDLIIGGTNLMGKKGPVGDESFREFNDNHPMMQKLDQLIAAVKAGGVIKMDGKKVADIVDNYGNQRGLDS